MSVVVPKGRKGGKEDSRRNLDLTVDREGKDDGDDDEVSLTI